MTDFFFCLAADLYCNPDLVYKARWVRARLYRPWERPPTQSGRTQDIGEVGGTLAQPTRAGEYHRTLSQL